MSRLDIRVAEGEHDGHLVSNAVDIGDEGLQHSVLAAIRVGQTHIEKDIAALELLHVPFDLFGVEVLEVVVQPALVVLGELLYIGPK